MEMEDLPPKTVKAQLVRLDDSLKRIERTQFAGIQRAPGSLPVLEAFQIFLEKERRKTQLRLLAVTGLAVITMLLTAVASALYIRHHLGNADERTSALARTTTAIEQSVGTLASAQQSADTRIIQAAETLAAHQATIQEHARQLAQQQQEAKSRKQESASDLIRIREQMESLLEDQENLRRMLARRSLAAPAHPATPTDAIPAAPAAPATIGPVRSRAEVDAANPRIRHAVVTLNPEGRGGIRWMLPTIANVPE